MTRLHQGAGEESKPGPVLITESRQVGLGQKSCCPGPRVGCVVDTPDGQEPVPFVPLRVGEDLHDLPARGDVTDRHVLDEVRPGLPAGQRGE